MVKLIKNAIVVGLLFGVPLIAGINEDIKTYVSKSGSSFLKSAYSSNLYEPLWITKSGLSLLGKELLEQIKKDKTVASDLPFYKLYGAVKKDLVNKKYSASLDLKITKLYKAYMNYLINGGIDWKSFDEHITKLKKRYDYNVAWEHIKPPYSAKKILEMAKLNDSFGDYFQKVEPKRFKYKKLKKYLEKYIEISKNGGWKRIKSNVTLKPGISNANIPIIRKRLKLVGDLNGCSASLDSILYDNCMAKAVKRFRLRHGLKASSIIDRATRAELRKSVNYYIKKIRLNLDRIKWIRREEARVRIELNIPAFRLYLYDGKDLVTTMRVITGKPNHPTAIFSDVMTTIVVNPYWRIPESIVKKEMIKHLLKNPHYYDRQHKFLYNGWGADSEKVDPASVNWKKYLGNKKHIPYHFMQSPSGKNALGKIKFLFPNKYSVYIHDTPSKRLFFREVRAFSHGCMRIQKPRELLEALALYNSNVKVDSIMKRLGGNDNKHIGLKRKIPIDITYLTSFVDDYGNLHFRKDIYGYDAAQFKRYNKEYSFSKNKSKKSIKKANKKSKKSTDNKGSKKINNKKDEVKTKKVVKKDVKKANKKVNKLPNDSIKKNIEKKVKSKKEQIKKNISKKNSDYEVVEIGY